MKKVIFLILFVLSFIFTTNSTFASSNPDGDYTYIDCENGSDTSGTPFDSSQPYLSLKKGIESSIDYINQNGLTDPNGNGVAYTSFLFNIIVKPGCFFNGFDGNSISLGFNGINNNSTLQIAGVGGSFIVENITFNLGSEQAGNIIFRNIDFNKNDLTGYYFSGYNSGGGQSNNGNGVIIYNSKINISNGKTLTYTNFDQYCSGGIRCPAWYEGGGSCYCLGYSNYNYRSGGYYIENSIINVEISGNYNFGLPVYIKNSKINIKNKNTDNQKFNVYFYPSGHNNTGYNYGTINLLSNEIDMGGNNFSTENNTTSFLNNKFSNVGNFTIGSDETNTKYNTFVNNQINATNVVNITNNESAYNNVFTNGFTDTRDTLNFKRNFTQANLTEGGVGWYFKKQISSNTNINTDYKTFYKEVTGNDLPPLPNNPIYIVVH